MSTTKGEINMAKNDKVIDHKTNNLGLSVAVPRSSCRARRGGYTHPPKPINRKASHKPKRDRKAIEKKEAAVDGGQKHRSPSRKTGRNWRRQQQILAQKKAYTPEGDMNRMKKQNHYRSSDYYEDRRERDPEWKNNKPEEKKKTKWETLFPWIKRR